MARPCFGDRDKVKATRYIVRVSEKEYGAAMRAAALEGRPLSDFVRAATRERVAKVNARFPEGERIAPPKNGRRKS